MIRNNSKDSLKGWTRRSFIKAGLAISGLAVSGSFLYKYLGKYFNRIIPQQAGRTNHGTFIGKVPSYSRDITSTIMRGFIEIGVSPEKIRGKRILLKPNIIETRKGASHINTHPFVVKGAIEAFLKSGAASVIVAEGPGHCRDSLLVLEESGMGQILFDGRTPFIDLNYADYFIVRNVSGISRLSSFTFPTILNHVDWIVSMAKMKTHHWVGVTLSMKNLFGVMPGMFYGWPKNVLHMAGIEQCIIDINAVLRPHFAIVDGIMGMEGDGPIMGTPKYAGVIVMGQNLVSVDATCARIMGINPEKVNYIGFASTFLGPIDESDIPQRGERINSVQTRFNLLDHIPAQRRLIEL